MSNLEMIPQELRDRRQWVLWKTIKRGGNATKVPFQPTSEPAKANDPATWSDFETAVEHVEGYDGIGFVFSEDDPYCGVDIDGCRDPVSGEIAGWARPWIVDFGSYAEVSPSQTGVKIWVRGLWNKSQHKCLLNHATNGDKQPAFEVYDRGRYFAVTAQRLRGMSVVRDCQDVLDKLAAEHFKDVQPVGVDFRSHDAVVERARKYLERLPHAVSGQSGHNSTFHAACILVLGFGLGRDDAFGVLSEWNVGCQPPWSERELWHKIDSADSQPGDRNYLRNADPKNYDRIPLPSYKAPHKPKPETKTITLRDAVLNRVEKIRSGPETLIPTGIPELDNAIGGGVENGELVLLVARPSHGKSAVALQMVHHWTSVGLPTAFVSEEMSSIALGKRALQYISDIPTERWHNRVEQLEHEANVHFHDRATCIISERCKTAEAAADAIRAAKASDGIRCAIVDYAQLLSSPGKSRYEQVTNTSIVLRQVASELNIALIALCQMSRTFESRRPMVPQMSDIKETGQLEQDADVIVFLVWPHRIDSSEDPYKYMLFVGKNRNREIAKPAFSVRFEPSRQRFLHETVHF